MLVNSKEFVFYDTLTWMNLPVRRIISTPTVGLSEVVEKEVMVTLSKLKELKEFTRMTPLELGEELEMSDKEEPDLSPHSILGS